MTTPWSNQAVSLIVLIEEVSGFSGLFGYSPAPGPGNLIFSITANAGTDPYGNSYQQGVNTYPTLTGTPFAGQVMAVGLNQLGTGSTVPGLSVSNLTNPVYAPPGVFAGASDAVATPVCEVGVFSGRITSADVAAEIIVTSQNTAPVTTNGFIGLNAGQITFGYAETMEVWDSAGYVDFNNLLLSPPSVTITEPNFYALATANSLSYQTAALGGAGSNGMQGFLPLSQTQQVTNTVTGTGFSKLSPIWSVPANDPVIGTSYRLTAWGDGKTGSTAEALNFRIACLGGTSTTLTAGALWANTSTNFFWHIIAEVLITATGGAGSGNAIINVHGGLSLAASLLPNSVTANSTLFMTNSTIGVGITTTAASNITLQAGWAATTGAPTLTCRASIFERLGQ